MGMEMVPVDEPVVGPPSRIYYAHCQAIYGSPQETRDLYELERLGFEVLNPRDYGTLVEFMARLLPNAGNKMSWFEALVDSCDALAFRALPSGEIPAGIAREISRAKLNDIPVIELPSLALRKVLSVTESVAYLQEVGQR